jgi:hypothetical protein
MDARNTSANRALGKLLALNLGGKRLGRTDELADGGLFKLLGHKFQTRSRVGNFLGKDRDVSLLTGQAIKRKGKDNIDLALPNCLPQLAESRSLSPFCAGMNVLDYRNRRQTKFISVRPTTGLLRL